MLAKAGYGHLTDIHAKKVDLAAARPTHLTDIQTKKRGCLRAGTLPDGEPCGMTTCPCCGGSGEVEDELMCMQEAAFHIGIPYQRLRKWRMQGKGPDAVERGGRVLYRASEVRRWLTERGEQKGTTEP